MNRITTHICFLVAALALAGTLLPLTFAAAPTEPIGPNTITFVSSTRLSNTSYGPKPFFAEAGNITDVDINATSPTRAWAGFVGDIVGQIVLQDANNFTLYDWANLEPNGEVYASTNLSVGWSTIRCFNHTSDAGYTVGGTVFAATSINATTENARYNIGNTDPEAINATFNRTSHVAFNVGTRTIPANACFNTWTYVNSIGQTTNFAEVLLTDATIGGNALVFTTIIENDDTGIEADVVGYNGVVHDFQMLVAEDGHDGAGEDSLTTYYFWVELS